MLHLIYENETIHHRKVYFNVNNMKRGTHIINSTMKYTTYFRAYFLDEVEEMVTDLSLKVLWKMF